jgi:cytosine/adenosine deaminase-related metal-dependent hydrolase
MVPAMAAYRYGSVPGLRGASEGLLRQVVEVARERNRRITMHLGEEESRVRYIEDHHQASPVAFCDGIGMLGPNVLLAHCVNIADPAQIARLAETGTHVVHCPAANAKMGMGVAPIPDFLTAGVNVCVGTDSGPANNCYDLLRDLRWAACLHKAVRRDPTVVPAGTVVEMATLNGARAMGLESEIGSIEVGKRADFIVIDIDKPHFIPAPDPVSAIVYCATGADVDTVVIDGQVVMRGREVLTLDEQRILRVARSRASDLYARAGVSEFSRWVRA